MAAEDFFRNVRRAWGTFALPTGVEVVGATIGQFSANRHVYFSSAWAAPTTVSDYDPADFAAAPGEVRSRLDQAVDDFRTFAGTLDPNARLDEHQTRVGAERLERLAVVVRDLVLTNWKREVEEIIDAAESWCRERDWPTRRFRKTMRETLLEEYELPKLLFQVEDTRIELAATARFVAGASGRMDMAVVPSYDSLPLVRTKNGWQLKMDNPDKPDKPRSIRWGSGSFVKAVDWLRLQG